MSDIIRFTNGYILLPSGQPSPSDLYVSPSLGVIISGQSNFFTHHLPPARVVDLQGQILSPGLIDVQINGAYGVDFSELNLTDEDGGEARYKRGLEKVAQRIVETGCTSFVPTIITQEEALYAKGKQLLRLLSPLSPTDSAHILGYHAEGPYLHPLRRGAHSQTLLLTANGDDPMADIERVYGREGLNQEGVKIITAAPDVKGVMGCVEELTKRGVTFSIGHSDADLDTATEAVKRGAKMITHLFNAMPPIHHRDPGVIGLLGSSSQRPYYGIIVDGLHSHPNTVRIAYGAHKEGCVLVTDAQSIFDPNLPDGVYDWRPGVKFRKEGYKVVLDGTSTLAGSNSPLPLCIHNLSTWASISLPEALLTATLRPAQLLGGKVGRRKGQLMEGFDADLCIMGWDGEVRSTWIMGKEVWAREDWKAAQPKGQQEVVVGTGAKGAGDEGRVRPNGAH